MFLVSTGSCGICPDHQWLGGAKWGPKYQHNCATGAAGSANLSVLPWGPNILTMPLSTCTHCHHYLLTGNRQILSFPACPSIHLIMFLSFYPALVINLFCCINMYHMTTFWLQCNQTKLVYCTMHNQQTNHYFSSQVLYEYSRKYTFLWACVCIPV